MVSFNYLQMKTPKPKELTQEQLFELMKELDGLTFPNDFVNDLKVKKHSTKRKELTNMTFGRLLVISKNFTKKRTAWNCICTCGLSTVVTTMDLMSGDTKSCGCLFREKNNNYKHGMAANNKISPELKCWYKIRERCYSTKDPAYERYGMRGILMSDEWYNSAEQFLLDMGKKPSKNHSIDRIDNSKGYSKENCRWSTYKEQANNTRKNVWITFEGKTYTQSKWAEILNIDSSYIIYYFKRGKSFDWIYNYYINKTKYHEPI